ncbi:unnamed protein product [Symbiodinium natans]|uniref:Uncharacterized protein n=1 Tax=Symbiodinium natans TaxID=878477 RepID=A0A812RV03_9DINO|nr:unnamed protein product [Symbiodinium natans]
MPLKKKNLKKKVGGKVVNGEGSPKASPKAAPETTATSPKQSPKAAPAAEPVAAKKGKKDKKEKTPEAKAKASPKAGAAFNPPKQGRAAPRPPPTEAEREEAMKKAILLIKEGIATKDQSKGAPFILENWHQEWKPVLGPYRKFVESCACFRIVQGSAPAHYSIQVVDGAEDGHKAFWLVNLEKAWQAYCRLKKDKRSVDEFLNAAKEVVRKEVPVAAEEPDTEKGKKRKDEAPKAKSSKKAKTKAKE